MKKISFSMVWVLVAMMFASCATMASGETSAKNSQADYIPINERAEFVDTKEAAELLAKNDEYMQNISLVDIQSIFKSDSLPNESQRAEYYSERTLEWTETDKEKILIALSNLAQKAIDLNLNLPKKIKFIKSDEPNEGGVAYTREDYILLSTEMFQQDAEFLTYLIAHEVFHIYSRYNYKDKPELYEIIGFKECENLIFPDELKDLKLTNPDAPLNNYYIECEYDGEKMNFIPVIYRQKPFDINVDTDLFDTMIDPMLAVEIVNGKPEPIYRGGKPLVVAKLALSDFYTKIGKNTNYTLHPEEILADNFAKYIADLPINSPWVIEELLAIMKTE